ncbi:hypothetical protein CB0940_03803 [Cercospora beticola]|uniref:Uncharacterized protein n=1 Tax=Cercospora beticola TaxID=122368 RepID=A0A2G5I5S7_CERBT|nr:hypothetical protein CB0940_03803 [Cercospora beticola]PIB00122.1 hypothetical protein CB0940_03803 [Cercospora beticola]WPB00996.1 hypothetical protein RHO25_005616 [Cercospora beticola]CAK1360740.1 unnamed protein product [Cercospora beticola]
MSVRLPPLSDLPTKLLALLAPPAPTLSIGDLSLISITREHFLTEPGWLQPPISKHFNLPLKVWTEPFASDEEENANPVAEHPNPVYDILFATFDTSSPDFGKRDAAYGAVNNAIIIVRTNCPVIDIPAEQDPVGIMLAYLQRKAKEVSQVLAIARKGPEDKLRAYQALAQRQFTAEAMAKEFVVKREQFIKAGITRFETTPNAFLEEDSIAQHEDHIGIFAARKRYGIAGPPGLRSCEAPSCAALSPYLLPISCGIGATDFWHCGQVCMDEAMKALKSKCGHVECGHSVKAEERDEEGEKHAQEGQEGQAKNGDKKGIE